MKLSKLYCSHSEAFKPIVFKRDLNIVLAEIRNPENHEKTTHDLGKTLLCTLLNYCLLKKSDSGLFLNKHYEKFKDFEFYLEIVIDLDSFYTIKRSVKKKSNIEIYEHGKPKYLLEEKAELIFSGGINKAKDYLNSELNFEVLRNRNYRSSLSYFLRDQSSFTNVFKTSNFNRSKDIDWKSPLSELFSINSSILFKKLEIESEIKQIDNRIRKISLEADVKEEKYKTMLSIKKEQLKSKEEEIDTLNFKKSEDNGIENLVEVVDRTIQKLVTENYYLSTQIHKSQASIINNENPINLKLIEKLYNDIQIYFDDQLIKDYSDLIDFNNQIFNERNEILKGIISKAKKKLEVNNSKLEDLYSRRSRYMSFIVSMDSFEKMKKIEQDIIDLKVDIQRIEEEIQELDGKHRLELEKRNLKAELEKAILELQVQIYSENNVILNSIKRHFSEIIYKVLNEGALISVSLNNANNIDFKAEIFDLDIQAQSSKDKGTTYKKLMCFAFDMAILATYKDRAYYHFVYHDGLFDGLDNRQKENLYNVILYYVKEYEIQYIFSVIQDELPPSLQDEARIEKLKQDGTIIKVLHDNGNEGRLFNVDPF